MPGLDFFVRPAHLKAAPHSLWAHPIVVPQSLRLPAHSPPSHRIGVVPFGRCIPRRAATDLVFFHLAGAFPTEPPPIWCCFIWPAHSPPSRPIWCCSIWPARSLPFWSLHLPAHSPPTHQFGVDPFGWRIPSPRHHRLYRLAHPIAVPIVIFCRRIPSPSPCLQHLSWSVHPIAAPPYRISLHARKQKRVSVSAIIENHGASHRRTSIAYLGLRFGRRDRLDCRAAMNHPHWAGALAVDC